MKVLARKFTLAFLDIFLVTVALYFSVAIKYGVGLPSLSLKEWQLLWLTLAGISLICNYSTNLYRSLWQYASINELLYILLSGVLTGVFYFFATSLLDIRLAYSVYFLIIVFNTTFLGLSRMGYRIMRRFAGLLTYRLDQEQKKR